MVFNPMWPARWVLHPNVFLEQRASERETGVVVGQNADHSGPGPVSPFKHSIGLAECSLGRCCLGSLPRSAGSSVLSDRQFKGDNRRRMLATTSCPALSLFVATVGTFGRLWSATAHDLALAASTVFWARSVAMWAGMTRRPLSSR